MLTRTAIAIAAVVSFGGCALAQSTSYPMQNPIYGHTPMITADASLAFGGWWYSEGSYHESGTFLDADGRVNIPLGNGWNLMPEAYLSADLTYDYALVSGILHLYKNLPNTAIGPFVAVSGFTDGGPTAFTFGAEARTRALGPNVALTGQASVTTVDSFSFGQFGGFLDYYFTPECKFTGALQVASGSGETVFEGSAKLTRHLANTRFNIFAAAYVDSYNYGGSEFSAEIGATANIGSIIENLFQQDDNRPFHFTPIGEFGVVEAVAVLN